MRADLRAGLLKFNQRRYILDCGKFYNLWDSLSPAQQARWKLYELAQLKSICATPDIALRADLLEKHIEWLREALAQDKDDK